MNARNQKIFIQHQERNHLRLQKHLGLYVANKQQPKVRAASYDASPIIDERVHVFKHEFTAEIM